MPSFFFSFKGVHLLIFSLCTEAPSPLLTPCKIPPWKTPSFSQCTYDSHASAAASQVT